MAWKNSEYLLKNLWFLSLRGKRSNLFDSGEIASSLTLLAMTEIAASGNYPSFSRRHNLEKFVYQLSSIQ